jgi:hypothetical protein
MPITVPAKAAVHPFTEGDIGKTLASFEFTAWLTFVHLRKVILGIQL